MQRRRPPSAKAEADKCAEGEMRKQHQRQEEWRGQHEEERRRGDHEQRGDILAAAGEEQDERVAKDGAERQIELCGKWDGIHAEGKDRIDPEQQENSSGTRPESACAQTCPPK